MNEINLLKDISGKKEELMKLIDYHIDTNNQIYLICEYIEGTTLLDYLYNNGNINEYQAKKIIFDIINGVNYLHVNKILHRDLKLENIIMIYDKNGIYSSIKIIDLGLSEKINGYSNKYAGTPNYMPPEVFKNLKYDFKFDVFSIGVIF